MNPKQGLLEEWLTLGGTQRPYFTKNPDELRMITDITVTQVNSSFFRTITLYLSAVGAKLEHERLLDEG